MNLPVAIDTSTVGRGEESIETNLVKLKYVPIPDYDNYHVIGPENYKRHLDDYTNEVFAKRVIFAGKFIILEDLRMPALAAPTRTYLPTASYGKTESQPLYPAELTPDHYEIKAVRRNVAKHSRGGVRAVYYRLIPRIMIKEKAVEGVRSYSVDEELPEHYYWDVDFGISLANKNVGITNEVFIPSENRDTLARFLRTVRDDYLRLVYDQKAAKSWLFRRLHKYSGHWVSEMRDKVKFDVTPYEKKFLEEAKRLDAPVAPRKDQV